ncbi:carboxymuconolactone decarboxylase family protein [Streptomyces sp. NPDC008163]|uniref:carboxymuconolactone decarboxylase family protein n=1 Tax=Streptomyces sp. NPDC008163 TaxID=3364818 RepID=UPI0036EE0C23
MDREIVIARVTARSGCAYEWGVHAATLAPQAGLGPELLRAIAQPDAVGSAPWSPRHTALLRAVDELDDTTRLTQSAWDALRMHYEEDQVLELFVLIGWYRTISGLANGLLLDEEPWGARFPHGDAFIRLPGGEGCSG